MLRRCVWSRNIKNGCSIYIYDISRLRVKRPSYFASWGRIYVTHHTGSWVGPWNCMNLVTKKNIRPVFSGMLRHAYLSTRRKIPENTNLQQHRLENFTRRKIITLTLPAFKYPWPPPPPQDGHYSDWATPSSYVQLHSPHLPYFAITRAKYARFEYILRADKKECDGKRHHVHVCHGRSVLLLCTFIWMQDMNELMPTTDWTPWSNITYMMMSYNWLTKHRMIVHVTGLLRPVPLAFNKSGLANMRPEYLQSSFSWIV